MYSGPKALAAIIGWTTDQVRVSIRAAREASQAPVRHTAAGNTVAELVACAQRAGWQHLSTVIGPLTYAEFLRQHGQRGGAWLLEQGEHFGAYVHRVTPYHSSQAKVEITRAYRLALVTKAVSA